MRPYTTNYSGRQVDVEMMKTISTPSGITPLELAVAPTGRMVAGMQKLAQRYTILLLTQLGDLHFDPSAGTEFVIDLFRGASQNPGQINFVFALASVAAISQMKREDAQVDKYGAIPPDEQIVRATLLDWSVNYSTGILYLKVDLRNREGDSYVYILPAAATRR